MPIYEYRCEDGHTFEVMQRMSDDPLVDCTECGAPVQRVFHPVAIHFKGSGFYNTDYGKKRRGGSAEGDSGSSKGESKEPAGSTSSSDSRSSGSGSDSSSSGSGSDSSSSGSGSGSSTSSSSSSSD